MKFVTLVLLVLFSSKLLAANTVDEVVNPILLKIDKGEFKTIASDSFPDGSAMRQYISASDIKQLDSQMLSYLSTMGKSNGYQLYLTSDVPRIYEHRYYLFRFDRQPVIVKFEIYKANKSWEMHSVSLDFELDSRMEESAKIRLGGMGLSDLRKNYEANKRLW